MRISPRARCHAVALLVAMLAGVSAPVSADQAVGITVDRLTVLDLGASGRAKTQLRARDAAIPGGVSGDSETTAVRILLDYVDGSASGAFMVPSGGAGGWRASGTSGLIYANSAAPKGPTQVRRFVFRSGGLSAVAMGLGDVPLDLSGAGAPAAGVYVTVELTEAGAITRLCALMTSCRRVSVAGGSGAKLTCRGGTPDPTCHGARQIFLRLTDVRYGGPGTVAIIGDSIIVQADDALDSALAGAGWYTLIDPKIGAMFRERQAAAAAAARANPDVAVMHLGSNDFACCLLNAFDPATPCRYPDFGPDDEVADARAMAATFAAARCRLGTTVWFGTDSDPVNPLWREMAESGELSGIVPWEEYLEALAPEEQSLLLADGVGHLTTAGRAALATLTAQVVDAVCGPAPAAP